ncbi:MAG: hypothetical protein HY304_08765 [candidate division Zixibacteria bacterium]|nr:hypothetical protein [candidate division Zixibacteria bacterium]
MLKTFDRLLRIGLLTGLGVIVMPVMLGSHLQAPDQAATLPLDPSLAEPWAHRGGADSLAPPAAPLSVRGNIGAPSTRGPADEFPSADLSSWDKIRILFR